ncbi:protease modulator HflC [Pleionea litopenaei]|uniref:Protein HflC n=1 Tax=Pleionea litopenaei TaxID=3070815 RepID=A0AA51RWV1_9GAMM|nr:protease modulator HflC [Pleionea sp. HL-JVS1]WMS88985.1 protease modulator HflC [Pleionea sp. HL-JVS1]
MQFRTVFIVALVGLLVITGANSIFRVNEAERALKLRFGKVERDANDLPVVFEPGLHFKLPFFENMIKLDARVQTMDPRPDVFTTSNKQFLNVDTYVLWRVNDFSQFYLRTNGQFREAEKLIERLVDNGLRDQFGQRTLQDSISEQRQDLMEEIRSDVNQRVPEYGIEVVDIRVKKVNYTPEVVLDVYEQIKSERRATAIDIRSQGQKEGNILKAKTDADVQRIIAEADEYARTTRGEADAEVARIYAETYNKNPEFYAFLRSLDAYKKSFSNKDDVLVIKPDSEFFKYLKDSSGK